MKASMILKLSGFAILTMATLVAISFLEVALYSHFTNPGQPQEIYETHANFSAPYISGIFGFVIFFLVARHWKKKANSDILNRIILFPLIYVLLDLVIIISAGVDWTSFLLIFTLANGAKFLGSYLGYRLTPTTR